METNQAQQLKIKFFDELTPFEIYEILRLRSQIFLMEQNIICLDADRADYKSLHCFIEAGGEILGCLRAFYEGNAEDSVRISRVVTARHGEGLGKLLFERAIPEIKRKMPCKSICVHSQKQAQGFYEKMGFEAVGEDFLDTGIPHVKMILRQND